MKRIVKIAALAAMVLALAGCKGRNRGPLLPNVSGKAGEIVVVIDKDNWEGEIGNALRGILADDCPYLAQREPLFNLANVPPGSFNNMFKMHRNILILNINPQNQTTGMMYKRDAGPVGPSAERGPGQCLRPGGRPRHHRRGEGAAARVLRGGGARPHHREFHPVRGAYPASLPCATPWRSLPAASCISLRATSSAR